MAAEQEAEETVSQELHSASELRIVLLGRGWDGKSEAGNTILGREEFISEGSFFAVTPECEKRTGEVSGRRVTVVDTPDLLDTDWVEIERCLSLSAPGPHALLLVMCVYEKGVTDTYRESMVELYCKSFDKVQQLFGEKAVRNTMILFTCGDRLRGRTIEQHIEEAGEEFQQLVEKCGNRYHVLNNKNRSDRTQVTQLLDKIDNMVKGSGGCYTMEMYLEEKIRQKEQKPKKKHKEELRRREEMKQKYEEKQRRREEEMKQKYEEEQRRREEELMEKLRKQMKEEALEKEAEESKLPVRRRNSIDFSTPNMSGGEGEAPTADNRAVLLGAVAGALLGAAAGALIGPLGAAAGAAIGSVAGAQVGALIGGAARSGVAESSDTHTQRSRELV